MQILKNAISGVPITGGYSSVSELFQKYDADKSGQIDRCGCWERAGGRSAGVQTCCVLEKALRAIAWVVG